MKGWFPSHRQLPPAALAWFKALGNMTQVSAVTSKASFSPHLYLYEAAALILPSKSAGTFHRDLQLDTELNNSRAREASFNKP